MRLRRGGDWRSPWRVPLRWWAWLTLLALVVALGALGALGSETARLDAAPPNAQPVSDVRAEVVPPLAVVGDFNADVRADLLWYGPGASADHVWLGAAYRRFAGRPVDIGGDYRPLAGDFDCDDHQDVFWFGSGNAPDYVWFGGSGGAFVGRQEVVGGSYQPFVADFDGDTCDDLFWYQPGPEGDVVWYGTPRGAFEGLSVTFDGTQSPVVGDFDGSGTADILWYGEGPAADALWRGVSSRGFSGRPARIATSYQPRVGDFNGDRRDDVLWFGPGSAPDAIWYGTGTGGFVGRGVTAGAGRAPLVGDFDGNGASDLFWYQPGRAPDPVWYGHAAGFSRVARAVNGTYVPIVADFDGDRRTDVLWYAAGAPPDPLWYGVTGGDFASKSSIVDIQPALAPPVDLSAVRSDYDRYGVLAHEMGPTPQRDGYTSSLEAFNHNFERGFRVFEADFVRLADGSALAAHDGFEEAFGLTRPFDQVTRTDMASRQLHVNGHAYTPLFSDDVVRLMREHPDIYVVLDTKDSDVAIFARFLRDAGGDPAVMERVIPHIYDQGQLNAVQDLYPVHSYMVALYRSQYYGRLDDNEVVALVRANRAPGVMMWSGVRNPLLSLGANMAQRRRYTDAFAGRLEANGAVVFVHSISAVREARAFKAKGVGIYSSAPFPPYSESQPEAVIPEFEADEREP